MPSLITKRGKKMWRGSIMVSGARKDKLFPDATKASERAAAIWEEQTRKALLETSTDTVCWTILDWFNEYLDESRERFTRRTFKEKQAVIKNFCRTVNPNDSVQELHPMKVVLYLRAEAKKRSGYAANRDRKNLAAAWEFGRKFLTGFPQTMINPFRAVSKLPEKRSPRYVPPESDFWKVFEVSSGQDRVMLFTFLHLAARRNEVFSLTWDDFDFSSNRVRLWTSKRECGNREFDWLPMTSDLKKVLLEWWQERPIKDTISVFVCLDRQPYCQPFYGKPFTKRIHLMRRLCTRAGVKPFGFHAIRHLTASILYHRGCDVAVIQAILRHKSPTTTTKYLRTLGLEQTRLALEENLRNPGKIVSFPLERAAGGEE